MGACRSGRRASAAGLEVSRLQPLRTEAAHLQFDPRSAGFSALSSGGDAPNSVRVLRARAQSLALPGRRPWVQVTIDDFALRNVSAINIRRRLDLKPAAGRRRGRPAGRRPGGAGLQAEGAIDESLEKSAASEGGERQRTSG